MTEVKSAHDGVSLDSQWVLSLACFWSSAGSQSQEWKTGGWERTNIEHDCGLHSEISDVIDDDDVGNYHNNSMY